MAKARLFESVTNKKELKTENVWYLYVVVFLLQDQMCFDKIHLEKKIMYSLKSQRIRCLFIK